MLEFFFELLLAFLRKLEHKLASQVCEAAVYSFNRKKSCVLLIFPFLCVTFNACIPFIIFKRNGELESWRVELFKFHHS